MKFLKKAAALLMAAAMAFSITACSSSDEVVAEVNDNEITQSQLDSFIAISTEMLGEDMEDVDDEAAQQFLDELVQIEALKIYYEGKDDDVYGDDFDTAAQSFVDSAHDSDQEYLDQFSISDEDLKDYYGGQFLVSALYTEIQQEYTQDELYALSQAYYEENREQFKNEDGSYMELDDVIQTVYYYIYSEFYSDRIDEIMADMDVEYR